jgi:hypothetical protein
VKDIGKPDAGKLHVWFDEGRLINDQYGGHVVAACGKASAKVPDQWSDISCYSTLLYFCAPFSVIFSAKGL